MKRRVKPYLGDSYNRVTKTTLTKRNIYILSDINSTLSESGPDDDITEDEFNEALRRNGRHTLIQHLVWIRFDTRISRL